ncbi:hypothetical protein [Winogradskyella sediminis]|uniref:Uncharacterized protein n=1 Tax=Winogradskyella sediminis TaxID=1382466 RepID=A0A1H1SLZ6_9FLAO|nr:hypothetical protein [Winogradskyella sediminis]SDS48853.1 hypothetical protein SAMN04489797_1708 [Winogradskyella sediminis]
MIWFIIIIIILFIVIKFTYDLNKDKNDLRYTTLDKKFNVIVNILNKGLFNGKGSVTKIDNRSFNLSQEGSNRIISFFYSTGTLELKLRYKYLQKEVIYSKSFNETRNLSLFEQQNIAECFILEIQAKIDNHKESVMNQATELNPIKNTETVNHQRYLPKLKNKPSVESLKIECQVKINGFYYHNYNGLDIYGNAMIFKQLLFFLDDKYVSLIELDKEDVDSMGKFIDPLSNQKKMKLLMYELKESIVNIKGDEYNRLDSSLGRYKFDNETIELLFFNPKNENNEDIENPRVYKRLYGVIKENSIVLNQSNSFFDHSLIKYREADVELLNNSEFNYYSL